MRTASRTLPLLLLLFGLILSTPAIAAAAKIEDTVSVLKKERERLLRGSRIVAAASELQAPSQGDALRGRIEDLEESIRKGEAASRELRAEIAQWEAQTKQLSDEKRQLERIQATLTSGLIGALVTAAVAIAGALSGFGKSRVDRDFRRLELIEKAHQLRSGGRRLPEDIIARYLPGGATSGIAQVPPRGSSADEA